MTFFDRRSETDVVRSAHATGLIETAAATRVRSRVLPPLLPALFCLFAVACQSPVERADGYAQQAQALTDAGDNKGALQAINKAIMLRDDTPAYFLLLGSIDLRGGDPVGAYRAYSRVLELDATNIAALTFVANLGLQVGQIAQAGDAADRLLTLNPNSLVGLQVKGLIEVLNGKLDSGEDYANKILAISPQDEAGTIVRTRALARAGRFDEALAQIDKAMSVTGATPAMLITKLNLYRALRQPDKMAEVMDALMPLMKGQASDLRLDQINLLYKSGKTAEARKASLAFLAAGSSDPTDYRTLQRIWSEFDPKPFDRTTIKQARQWPDPLALVAVGRYLLWKGEPQLADDQYFASRLEIRRIGISIHARAQFGLGRISDARYSLDNILNRDGEDVDALLLRAWSEQKDGHHDLAIEAAQKAIDSDPFDSETYIVLAELNRAAGTNWRATQVIEDGLKQLPQNFQLIEYYTRILHELGDKSRAVSVTRAFARTLPSSAKAWSILAAQCAWANDSACASEAEKGRQNAQVSFQIDEPPGAAKDRGLFGRF